MKTNIFITESWWYHSSHHMPPRSMQLHYHDPNIIQLYCISDCPVAVLIVYIRAVNRRPLIVNYSHPFLQNAYGTKFLKEM
jgi:hypothetical protein